MAIGALYKQVFIEDDEQSGIFGNQTLVYDYDNLDDFNALWCEQEGSPQVLARLNGRNRIIIAWDGCSDESAANEDRDARTLRPHLTPLDWALAFSIKLARDHSNDDGLKTGLGIHIIDLTGRDHTAWAMRMRHQLLADMPWVTLHAPLLPEKSRFRAGYGNIDGDLLEKSRSKGWAIKPPLTPITPNRQSALGELARQWTATLIDSGDHHDLNNIIGPFAMAKTSPGDGYQRGLYRKLDWQGLLPKEGVEAGACTLDDEPVTVLAIDDQLPNYWDVVIYGLFGLNVDCMPPNRKYDRPTVIGKRDEVSLLGLADPQCLCNHLTPPEGQPSLSYPFEMPARQDQGPWLLVLDVYLFGRRFSEELVWFGKLVELARTWPTDSTTLPWIGFSGGELDQIEAWRNKSGGRHDSPHYYEALSLLPRLCALRWPATPIVLFSASKQRGLVERLKPYGNIIIGARKPDFLRQNSDEEQERFLTDWREVLEAARPWLKVQRKLQALLNPPQGLAVGGGNGGDPQGQNNLQHRHLTIALDETGNFCGDDASAIGGVIVEASDTDKDTAQGLTKNFLESLRQKEVNFYDHAPAYTDMPGGQRAGTQIDSMPIAKNGHIDIKIRDVLTTLGSVKLSVFRLLVPKGQYLGQQQHSDGTYLKWLNVLLELLFAEYLPSAGYLNKVSIALWLPQRVKPGNPTPIQSEAIRYDFNFHQIGDNKSILFSLGGRSLAYALIGKALGHRATYGKVLDEINVLKLRKIPYYNGSNGYESAVDWYCPECHNYAGVGGASRKRIEETTVYQVPLGDVKNGSGRKMIKGHRVCSSHPNQFPFADYSVAQHLADAALDATAFPNREFGAPNVNWEGSFDIEASGKVLDFLRVASLMEQGDQDAAFRLAFKYAFFLDGLNQPRTPSQVMATVHARLVTELRNYGCRVPGNVLQQLAIDSLRHVQQQVQQQTRKRAAPGGDYVVTGEYEEGGLRYWEIARDIGRRPIGYVRRTEDTLRLRSWVNAKINPALTVHSGQYFVFDIVD